MTKIDAFAHIHPPDYSRRVRAVLARDHDARALEEWDIMLREDPALIDLEARWHSMERFDDYVQILVPGSPAIESLGSPPEVAMLARELNDELAALVSAHPDRFAGFAAALPVSDVELAVTELER
ncbi:MAG: amidohydrolase family protein, partial [Solirubrobacteraceae bacterium]